VCEPGSARAASPTATGYPWFGASWGAWCEWSRCRSGGGCAGCDFQAVGGELASYCDSDDPARSAAGVLELVLASVQAALGLPGDVDDFGCLAALAALERFADDWAAGVVVEGLTSSRRAWVESAFVIDPRRR
jgi:hypothetical protein